MRELEAALAAKQALVEALHSKNCMLTILNRNLLMRLDALGRSLALPPAAPPAALHLRISLPGAPASRWLHAQMNDSLPVSVTPDAGTPPRADVKRKHLPATCAALRTAVLHLRFLLPSTPASRWLHGRCTTRCQSL